MKKRSINTIETLNLMKESDLKLTKNLKYNIQKSQIDLHLHLFIIITQEAGGCSYGFKPKHIIFNKCKRQFLIIYFTYTTIYIINFKSVFAMSSEKSFSQIENQLSKENISQEEEIHDSASYSETRKLKKQGRWDNYQSTLFIKYLEIYGSNWRKIARKIPSRTPDQVRSHAQKYFLKLHKIEQDQKQINFVSQIGHDEKKGRVGLRPRDKKEGFYQNMNDIVQEVEKKPRQIHFKQRKARRAQNIQGTRVTQDFPQEIKKRMAISPFFYFFLQKTKARVQNYRQEDEELEEEKEQEKDEKKN